MNCAVQPIPQINRQPLKRYWQAEILGGADREFSWLRLWRRVSRGRINHYLFWFRIADHLHFQKGRTRKSLAKRINNWLIRRRGIEIMLGTQIDEGLQLGHGHGIVISNLAVIGRNFTVHQNTTIGTDYKSNAPILIGDDVWIGANSCIIGSNLRIGDGVTIGAMSFVNRDIPSHHVFYTEKIPKLRPKAA